MKFSVQLRVLLEHPKYIIYTCLHLGYTISLEKQEIILRLLLKEDCQHLPMFTEMFVGFPVWVAAQLC